MQPPRQAVSRRPWQRYLAEFIGTFAIVFVACGAVISDAASGGAVTLLGIALAPGLMVLAMIYALGPVCAAHFNPAVTIGFAVSRRFPWRHVAPYILAQVGGALLASALHLLLYGRDVAMPVSFGAHIPRVAAPQAIGFEIVFGFFLMFVIMAVATDKRVSAPVPGLAIGLTVALAIMFGGPISGRVHEPRPQPCAGRVRGRRGTGFPAHLHRQPDRWCGDRGAGLRSAARWVAARAVRAGGSGVTARSRTPLRSPTS
ncbi:MAG: hypothetical protein KatS3mg053_1692 [Candidatus Roseilinea sp.]|nr:MAG: hypothetical protein KatS3mg053_1692 [Candidatus Roseilinea sp.]